MAGRSLWGFLHWSAAGGGLTVTTIVKDSMPDWLRELDKRYHKRVGADEVTLVPEKSAVPEPETMRRLVGVGPKMTSSDERGHSQYQQTSV